MAARRLAEWHTCMPQARQLVTRSPPSTFKALVTAPLLRPNFPLTVMRTASRYSGPGPTDSHTAPATTMGEEQAETHADADEVELGPDEIGQLLLEAGVPEERIEAILQDMLAAQEADGFIDVDQYPELVALMTEDQPATSADAPFDETWLDAPSPEVADALQQHQENVETAARESLEARIAKLPREQLLSLYAEIEQSNQQHATREGSSSDDGDLDLDLLDLDLDQPEDNSPFIRQDMAKDDDLDFAKAAQRQRSMRGQLGRLDVDELPADVQVDLDPRSQKRLVRLQEREQARRASSILAEDEELVGNPDEDPDKAWVHELIDDLQVAGEARAAGKQETPKTRPGADDAVSEFSLGRLPDDRVREREEWQRSVSHARSAETMYQAVLTLIFRDRIIPGLVGTSLEIMPPEISRSRAKVVIPWQVSNHAEEEAVAAELKRAEKRLRRHIAQGLNLKRTPAIVFRRTAARERQAEMDALFEEIHRREGW
ncbi:uncharacterized protein MONBRDRAFT_23636 [Monosiga brevicollis MX1]|uniref:Ribosome-binding factor A n=1 Tax=Monosiga brevicollis TaxID=81824 RepID=A9UU12_MONBE|nr:uncharacterized protein MONBRDRAFT_23636 [Monosiga brevicollis MX1]EDQ91341.1 predicted protein [Monosiga brevicollis MX1]|eukprot:XP_001743763.1 hypothetical protein [Monosiga brevicollis MX1]